MIRDRRQMGRAGPTKPALQQRRLGFEQPLGNAATQEEVEQGIHEDDRFQTLSMWSKARHDTAAQSIANTKA